MQNNNKLSTAKGRIAIAKHMYVSSFSFFIFIFSAEFKHKDLNMLFYLCMIIKGENKDVDLLLLRQRYRCESGMHFINWKLKQPQQFLIRATFSSEPHSRPSHLKILVQFF